MESQLPLCVEQWMTEDPRACWGVDPGSRETLCLAGNSALSRCGQIYYTPERPWIEG